jgi:hypothetical protein
MSSAIEPCLNDPTSQPVENFAWIIDLNHYPGPAQRCPRENDESDRHDGGGSVALVHHGDRRTRCPGDESHLV